jgi:hypothetical protein
MLVCFHRRVSAAANRDGDIKRESEECVSDRREVRSPVLSLRSSLDFHGAEFT